MPPAAAAPAPLAPHPPAPVKGMRVWTGARWPIWGLGGAFTVTRVSGASFWVREDGVDQKPRRLALGDWVPWLLERAKAGPLTVDGSPVRPPGVAPLFAGDDGGAPRGDPGGDGGAQARRVLCGVREVLPRFTITRQPDSPQGYARVRLTRPGWAAWYTVTFDPAWRVAPSCTCADGQGAAHRHPDRLCRHVVAVLLALPEHGHQLIDALL